MKILLTGPPGIGKSTTLANTIDLMVGRTKRGVIGREQRVDGIRCGFTAITSAGEEIEFMRKRLDVTSVASAASLPMVGSYEIDVAAIDRIVVSELQLAATDDCDIIYIDEIGRAQQYSDQFMGTVRRLFNDAMESRPHILATIVFEDYDWNIDLKRKDGVWTIVVSMDNRDYLPKILSSMMLHNYLFNQLPIQTQSLARRMFSCLLETHQYNGAKKLFSNALVYVVNKRVVIDGSHAPDTTEPLDLGRRMPSGWWAVVDGKTSQHRVHLKQHSETISLGTSSNIRLTQFLQVCYPQCILSASCDCDLFHGIGTFVGRAGETCSHVMASLMSLDLLISPCEVSEE